MSNAGYVFVGWGLSLGALAGYAVWLARRSRRAIARLPADRREHLR